LLGHALPLRLGLDRTGLNLLRLRLRHGRRSGAGLHLATIPLAATALPATALATALLPSAAVFTTPVFTTMVIAAAFLGKGRGRDGGCQKGCGQSRADIRFPLDAGGHGRLPCDICRQTSGNGSLCPHRLNCF
jgi:hypothetical protein